ncbi:MAG: DUF475 domain-containing protein [Oxalobacter sp.]|jgi:hypothetical protein|nr:MAG: DUF475 domain-containing protein [Oxalobacter sp.]
MLKSFYTYFTGSFLFCGAAVVVAYVVGGFKAALTVLFLTILETSLSFDNAVVNAGILKNWGIKWRRRFLTWGMLVAVFGMRLVFPMIIVGVVGKLNPLRTVELALYFPAEYSQLLESAHHQISAFGATFLMMVFFNYFVAKHKTEHWLRLIEEPLTRLGKMEAIEAALTLLVLLAAASALDDPIRVEFIEAGIWGIVTFILSKGMAALLGGEEKEAGRQIVRQGITGFLYLELIDSSFSFDGVVGAFALTKNLLFIMLGLGAGAMFVRSFTLLLVDNKTLLHYRYLEHGAFWAIGALAFFMMIGVGMRVPEAVTGMAGVFLIAASLGSSILANRK